MLLVKVSNTTICPHNISRGVDADLHILSHCSFLGVGLQSMDLSWSYLSYYTWKRMVLGVTLTSVSCSLPPQGVEGLNEITPVQWLSPGTAKWASLQQNQTAQKSSSQEGGTQSCYPVYQSGCAGWCCSNKLHLSHRSPGTPSALCSALGTHANRSPTGCVFLRTQKEWKDHSEPQVILSLPFHYRLPGQRSHTWVCMDESI